MVLWKHRELVKGLFIESQTILWFCVILRLVYCLSSMEGTLSTECLHVPQKWEGQRESISTVHVKNNVLFVKDAFQFDRDKPLLLFSGRGVGNICSLWEMFLTSPCSLKTFSLGASENAFEFSGDGGPLLTYIKQTSLAASSFSSLQILQAAAWRSSPWFQKILCNC